jgi:sulfopyruvate decarboxylase TPP-binding subunit
VADDIYRALLQVGIRQIAYVPDAGHTHLIQQCHANNQMKTVSLTTEEEGVAMLAAPGSARSRRAVDAVVGAGNCINMLSIIQECRFPLLMLITMRGEWGEFNPWQLAMGQSTRRVLEDIGIVAQHVDDATRVGENVFAAGQMAFSANRAVAVLIGQRVVGFKDWSK